MFRATKLSDVFGVAEEVNEKSYIDRGGLDAQFGYALSVGRHIVTHGASKQGKSWLRAKLLPSDKCLLVQCQIGSTIESIFTEALAELGIRAELKRTTGHDFEGTLSVKAKGSLGAGIFGKLGLEASGSGKGARKSSQESQAIGETPANLSWVAKILAASERRLVIEDCHYLKDEVLEELSFVLKALLGYKVFVVIAGVWAQDHLLTYYNGDLQGRIEDIHLTWSDEDLGRVLAQGAVALNISFSSTLRGAMVADAAGSVGLLQQLAEQVCLAEGILDSQSVQRYLTEGESLKRARESVAAGMSHRFESFAEGFPAAVEACKTDCAGQVSILKAILALPDATLAGGVSIDDLQREVSKSAVKEGDVLRFAEALSELQAHMRIRPPILEYNAHVMKIYPADRSLLFFRRYGEPRWPWGVV